MCGLTIALPTLLLLLTHKAGRVCCATCDSQTVTDPKSKRDSSGWVKQGDGAGERRQGHVTGAIVGSSGEDILVVYGGTDIRNDDVNDVVARTGNVSVLNLGEPAASQNWTELTMIGKHGVVEDCNT